MAKTTEQDIVVTTGAPDPHRRAEIEKYLDAKHVRWSYVPDLKIEEIDVNRSLANQARFEALKERVVEQYQEAMARGDEFPGILVSFAGGRKAIAVDGNHRLHAYISSGEDRIPAYVIEADTATITLMTYEANTKHGLPTSEDERTQHALWLLERGTTQVKAAEITALPLRTIKLAWEKSKSDARARQMSIRDWNQIPASSRQRLGAVRTDEGFVAAAKLANEAKLNIEEVNSLVTEINRARGGAEQISMVEKIRETYKERIEGTGQGTFKLRPSTPFGAFKSGTGLLRKFGAAQYADAFQSTAEMQDALDRAVEVRDSMDVVVRILSNRLELEK